MHWLHAQCLGRGALALIVMIALLFPSAAAGTAEPEDCCQRTGQSAGGGSMPAGQDAPSENDGCTTDCTAHCCMPVAMPPVLASALPTAPPFRIGSPIVAVADDYTPERPLPPPRA